MSKWLAAPSKKLKKSMTEPDESIPEKRDSPLWQLVSARLREFVREPAAIFWVYVFPLLMMVALGIAFRERPVQRSTIWVQQDGAAELVAASLDGDKRFDVKRGDRAECQQHLRIGQADLVVVAESSQHYEYFYDPTRPGSLLGAARWTTCCSGPADDRTLPARKITRWPNRAADTLISSSRD